MLETHWIEEPDGYRLTNPDDAECAVEIVANTDCAKKVRRCWAAAAQTFALARALQPAGNI
jgi:hypothetical protein